MTVSQHIYNQVGNNNCLFMSAQFMRSQWHSHQYFFCPCGKSALPDQSGSNFTRMQMTVSPRYHTGHQTQIFVPTKTCFSHVIPMSLKAVNFI